MGLFGDTLIFQVNMLSKSSGEPYLYNKKLDNNITFLLPYSCTSIIASQLTVLTSFHPKSLIQNLLSFIENPIIDYKRTSTVNGFELTLNKRNDDFIYNQFNPSIDYRTSPISSVIEDDIESILINYIYYVFNDSSDYDKNMMLSFLLRTISFFQEEILPLTKKIDIENIDEWRKLATTSVNFNSQIFKRWESQKNVLPNDEAFILNLNKAKSFFSY